MIDKDGKLPITLCVITCNSEDRIKEMILKAKDVVSEVMVVVQKSSDNTLAKVREVADVAIERRRKGTSDPDRNWLFDMARNEWILYLDDDEFLSSVLKGNLKKLINEKVDIYWFKRTNLVDGVDIFDVLGNDMQPRLFRKGSVTFPDAIHTYPKADPKAVAAFVEYDIVHERTLEQVKSGNRVRNQVASKETLSMQEDFISKVESLLKEKNN